MNARMKLNLPFALAAGLLFATGAIHAFMGGPEINTPVQQSTLDPTIRAILAVVWHAITVIGVVLGAAMLWSARAYNAPLVLTVLGVNIGFIGLFWALGLGRFGNVIQMPQWILFAATSAAILWGFRTARRS